MTGARQHRRPCDCVQKLGIKFSMHSQVSARNLGYFISEYRVPDEVTEDQLKRWHEQAQETDRDLVACNQCRRVALVGDGDREVLAGPEARGGAPV